MFRRLSILRLLLILIILFSITPALLAQDDEEVGDVVEIGGVIEIKVEADKPTVITDIKRQKAEIDVGELKRPKDSSLFNASSSIKPRLVDIEVEKIEKPKKMLAKVRKP